IEQFVARFRYKATKARQAQSRLKELERMEQIAPAHVDSPFRFSFPDADKASHPLVTFRDSAVGYEGAPVLTGVDFSLLPGARIGLLGPNGAGKSTLIRTLVGELPLVAGERTAGEHLYIGYFAQHQLDDLDLNASALAHLQRESPDVREQILRNFLGGFGFSGEDATSPVGRFSGGEKARLALARIAWRRPNLLLLDEPTNHLDLEMRHALDLALQSFAGAVMLVTHDRHLLRDTVDTFWLVADGRVREFDGDLDDYRDWLREYRAGRTAPTDVAAAPNPATPKDRKGARRDAARQRAGLKSLRDNVTRLEKAVAEKRAQLHEIDAKLADTGLYTDGARVHELQELQRRQGELRTEIDRLETEWIEASERLEAAQAD
ncbi:MAG: ATP-binding cassette domain-containing protein, partial [Halofilum sp. (in: g-proteobacteria)]